MCFADILCHNSGLNYQYYMPDYNTYPNFNLNLFLNSTNQSMKHKTVPWRSAES